MPALPNVPDVVRVVFSGTYGDTKWANIFHLKVDGGPGDATELSALLTALEPIYDTRLLNLCSVNAICTQSEARDLSSDTGASALHSGLTLAGTNSSTNLTAQASCCISWKIARHYRGGHPRTYLPGMGASSLADFNTWSSSFVTSAAAGAAGFITDIRAIGTLDLVHLVCVHYRKDGLQLEEPLVDEITSSAVNNRVDTQRRRLGR